ncbi:hypothetical protein ABIA03_003841 [Bradyrhizobium yuanmingense]|uniref:Uncharacterized protein n=1 Tax=Bradyrhizobium yuanmingense TaxID=108015 RepID=A0ABV4GFL5_9BRAD
MPGLVPGIHVLGELRKGVDGRVIGERKRRRPSDGYAGHGGVRASRVA